MLDDRRPERIAGEEVSDGSPQPATRAGAAVLAAQSLVLASLPASVLALSPSDGGPVNLFPVTINASPGDQDDQHVSGDLAAYTAGDNIRYYDFFLGNIL